MSSTISQTASHIGDTAPSGANAALIRHLLRVDEAAPVLLIRALSDTATLIAPFGQNPGSGKVFEGHMLAIPAGGKTTRRFYRAIRRHLK